MVNGKGDVAAALARQCWGAVVARGLRLAPPAQGATPNRRATSRDVGRDQRWKNYRVRRQKWNCRAGCRVALRLLGRRAERTGSEAFVVETETSFH